jgi:hypothetical protein
MQRLCAALECCRFAIEITGDLFDAAQSARTRHLFRRGILLALEGFTRSQIAQEILQTFAIDARLRKIEIVQMLKMQRHFCASHCQQGHNFFAFAHGAELFGATPLRIVGGGAHESDHDAAFFNGLLNIL